MTFLERLFAQPVINPSCFIAKGVVILGEVQIGKDCSIWFNAVLRADNDKILIGDGSNIQDGCIVHVDPGFPVNIGKEVIIGHKCIIHGSTIGDNTLVGMGSTIMNGVKIGKWCIIGANSLVTEGTIIPDGSVVMGSPAKVVKTTSEEQKEKIKKNALSYIQLSRKYLIG